MDTAKLFATLADHTRHVYPLATTIPIPEPTPTVAQAWEAFVQDCEQVGDLIGRSHCAWCEGEPGADGLLEHTEDCVFDALDRAVRGTR